MFRWKFSFWSYTPVRTTMPLTPTWAETFGLHSTHVCWLKCPLLSVLVWRKRRYIGHAKLLTPEKQRQTVLTVLPVAIFDILKLQLIPLGKFPLLSPLHLDKMGERKEFLILFLSHHLTSLDGKCLFYSTWILTTTSYTSEYIKI